MPALQGENFARPHAQENGEMVDDARAKQLTGIGTFYAGSGFAKEDAQQIADALNKTRSLK